MRARQYWSSRLSRPDVCEGIPMLCYVMLWVPSPTCADFRASTSSSQLEPPHAGALRAAPVGGGRAPGILVVENGTIHIPLMSGTSSGSSIIALANSDQQHQHGEVAVPLSLRCVPGSSAAPPSPRLTVCAFVWRPQPCTARAAPGWFQRRDQVCYSPRRCRNRSGELTESCLCASQARCRTRGHSGVGLRL